jgi:enterochelin esterase-like enzyme
MNRLLFLSFLLIAARFGQAQDKGTVHIDTLVSQALANTLTKEDNKRPLAIYLPPGYYASTKRYPVLYLLHGIGDDHMDFVDDTSKYFTIQNLMDSGIASHRFGEMIIVTPDEKTNWFGSFYTNSTATGNWEDFTAIELVNYMDSRYRTLARPGSRAIAGHSMGGYGAIRIAMKHPDVFSVAYSMNGAFICFAGENSCDSPDVKKFVLAKSYDELLATQRKNAMGMLTIAQAFSPNPDNPPFYADKPFKMEGDKVVPDQVAYNKWLDNDVVNMTDRYRNNLLKLRGIMFDAGDQDEWRFIVINNRLLSQKLASLHISYQYEEYHGDHRNKLWGLNGRIYNHLLPFVFDKMEK